MADLDTMLLLTLFGLVAGSVSTLAGLGGGLVLTLALATLWEPTRALATAAPALLLGNVHRVTLFRAHLDRRLAAPFVIGAVPGALLGGFAAVRLPEGTLRVVILGVALLAVVHELWGRRHRWPAPPTWAIGAGSFVGGILAATGGGGGLVLGPLLLAAGARGERFMVTASLTAICMHVARLVAYGASDVVSSRTLADALVVAAAIVAGNALGRRLREPLGLAGESRRGTALTYAVLGVSITLAVVGFA
ncbi:MAG: hypothetical protein CMN30_01070 [Sandaracinus sp.]|nr:hypothetical protein [Sandaracinus sp.]